LRNLLFLSHRIPYPPDKGDKIRAWHVLRYLAGTHRIHLGCFVDDPYDRVHVDALAEHCADLACFDLDPRRQRLKSLLMARPRQPLSVGYFRDSRLQRWVTGKLTSGTIDAVYVFSSAMASYVMDARGIKRILDMVDVDSAKWSVYAETARFPARQVWAREGRTLLTFERRVASQFDFSLFVSEHERQLFVERAPETAGRTGWVCNGVDLQHFSPTHKFASPFGGEGANLVFTGRMDYRPNIDAVRWFAREVLPLLRRHNSGLRFWIVGAAPTREVLSLGELPGVRVTGRVPDTRPYLAAADVVVAPLRIARGIQNKLLEAMAMARPVVATPEALSGVQARPGRDILLATGIDQTVRSIVDLLQGRHPVMGAAARRAVEAVHQWSVTLRPLDGLLSLAHPESIPTHVFA
jgi:sugar transferase (PEP-CTERM/EpsH1 system associated)